VNQLNEEDVKKRLEAKRAQKKNLEEELEKLQGKDAQLRQLMGNLLVEINGIQGGIDTLEELLGEKKPEEKK
jgi:hypothetical protein